MLFDPLFSKDILSLVEKSSYFYIDFSTINIFIMEKSQLIQL